jgi:subtilisin family serine protease
LFVAGLAHYVAPDAEIELRRVLNDEAAGTVASLIWVLKDIEKTEDLDKVVINLSLGYLPELLPASDFDWVADGQALQAVIRQLHDQGALIVAASGNNASWSADDQLIPGINYQQVRARYGSIVPARWSETIGVSGYGLSAFGNPVTSCFADGMGDGDDFGAASGFSHIFNDPTIQAPAGNGFDDTSKFDPGVSNEITVCRHPFTFANRSMVCGTGASAYDCQVALMSTTTNGYQHWMGTSFATPIVSGMAALLREACPTSSPDALKQHLITHFDPPSRFDVSTLIPVTCP